MKRYIVSQAKKIIDIGSNLDNHTPPCMEALAQLYIFPQYTEYHHHWAQEVWSEFKRISKIKRKNRYPDANYIYENSWLLNDDGVEVARDAAVYHESDLTPDPDRVDNLDELFDIMESYFVFVAETLSRYGKVTMKASQDKLRELNLIN